ncbi:MAG: 50S ribosomal protein L11 methyltransferase [Alphaproteobacteria bacterium]|nr:50S ribosomal protein L11 methyltransferase [Alphaproteobacteria bacterium]
MDTQPASNWQISFVLEPDAIPFFERALDGDNTALLASEIETGEDKGKWKLDAIFQDRPDEALLNTSLTLAAQAAGIPLPAYRLSELAQRDWLRENLISFAPVSVGRYYIYGSHIQEPPPKTKLSLKIDAATAFGSGEHFTTKGCLMAMEEISRFRRPKNILDMGCGSGILGLAAALTFRTNVMAADIDPESVRVTKQNAKNNRLARYITARAGNGYKPIIIRSKAPYDLVFSNILARPLTLMAKDLAAVLAPDGLAVLSGLLNRQEEWVLSAHRRVGLHLKKRYRLEGWSTLIVGR